MPTIKIQQLIFFLIFVRFRFVNSPFLSTHSGLLCAIDSFNVLQQPQVAVHTQNKTTST